MIWIHFLQGYDVILAGMEGIEVDEDGGGVIVDVQGLTNIIRDSLRLILQK